MRKRLIRAAATAVTVIGLSVPGVVAANSGSIDTTGPDSDNTVSFTDVSALSVDNKNDVDANLDTDQHASSGDAKVNHNTTGGDATSGDADNENSVDGSVEIDNGSACDCVGEGSGSSSGDISNTGPDSNNHITNTSSHTVSISNDNDIDFDSDVDQHAYSGDARVEDNTTGGNATSGSVSNTSNTTFSFSISN
jgi:hypothetical protein